MSTEPTLAQRILAAADAIEDLARLENYPTPDKVPFTADRLRREINMWMTAP